MSKKLTEQKIDQLIEELLKEAGVSEPLKKKYTDDELKYSKGRKAFHKFDNSNSLRAQSKSDKPSRKNLSALSSQEKPEDKLDINDIKRVLYLLTYEGITSVKSNLPKFRDWLFLSKKDINDRGTPEQKKYWNAAIDLLIQDWTREEAKGKSRYSLASKVGRNIVLKDYKIEGQKPKEKHYKNNWLDIEFDPSPAEEETIEFPEETPVQVDADLFNLNIANNPSEIGRFPQGVANSVDVIFKSTKNLVERMRIVTEISRDLTQPRSKTLETALATGKEYAKVVFYDFVNEIARNMDDRASAYLFESFLALCAGGRVEGAQATEGASTMGATDFTIGENVKGSCKYYSSPSNISQAISGFESKVPMHYIVAIKTKETSPEGQKILKHISIYYFKVIVEKLTKKVKIMYFAPNGQMLHSLDLATKGAEASTEVPLHFSILYGSETSMGSIELLADDRREYKETLEENLKKININLSDLVSKTSEISSDSRAMNRNTRQYIMKNDSTSGDQAVGDLNRVINNMQSLFNQMTKLGFKATEAEVAAKPTSESKQQTLNDLIAETMRDIKKKRKK